VNGALLRGEVDRNGFTWSKYDLPDPPNSWSLDPAPTAGDLTITHVKIDVTSGDQKIWIVGQMEQEIDDWYHYFTWLGKTTDGGDNWTWYPIKTAVDAVSAPMALSLDVDKENGSRVFFTGNYYPSSTEINGVVMIFDASTGGVTRQILSADSGSEYLQGLYPNVYCPYLPPGSAINGDYFILFGQINWHDATGDYAHLLYSPNLGVYFRSLVTPVLNYTDPYVFSYVDVQPGNENEICACYGYSPYPIMGTLPHYFASSNADKWYNGFSLSGAKEIPNYTPTYGFGLPNSRHARDASIILLAGAEKTPVYLNSPRYNVVMLSTDKGQTWYNLTANLREAGIVNSCHIDWCTIL
jgi:hypothetical protein